MTEGCYGKTKSGTPITDSVIEKLADEAELGFDIAEILARRGQRGRQLPMTSD